MGDERVVNWLSIILSNDQTLPLKWAREYWRQWSDVTFSCWLNLRTPHYTNKVVKMLIEVRAGTVVFNAPAPGTKKSIN